MMLLTTEYGKIIILYGELRISQKCLDISKMTTSSRSSRMTNLQNIKIMIVLLNLTD